MTDYSATNWLQYITGKTAIPTNPPTVSIGLFNVAPTSNSGVTGATEVSGGSYARVATSGATWNAAANSSGSEPSVTPASITNASAITFVQATASWGTVVAVGAFDAASVGNLLAWDYLGNFTWLPATSSSASPGVITAHAHGYANGDNVIISAKDGGTIPTFSQSNFTGILVVANSTTDTFTVTNAGTAVNTSSTGDFLVRKIVQQPIPSGSQFSVASGSFVITAA